MSLKQEIENKLNSLTKPIGSLGMLEQIALQIGLIQQTATPQLPNKKAVFVFSADHGIVEEGVSAYPMEVTAEMVKNFLNNGAAINVFANHNQAEVFVVDAGVASELPKHEKLLDKKVGFGTKNFLKECAMSKEDVKKSLRYGQELANFAKESNVEMVAVGDMGIGNTTTAAAIASALGIELDSLIDIGTVIPQKQVEHKKTIVEKALQKHSPFLSPEDVLEKVGGYCFAQMAGFILGCAKHNIPVVIDGFPSSVGALAAYSLDNSIKKYLFAGHLSAVKGHRAVLNKLGLKPILNLEMRLGEGTGAVLSFSIIEAAIKMINQMATFESAGVSKGDEKQ